MCRVKKDFVAASLKAKMSKAAGKQVPLDVAALLIRKDNVEDKLFDNANVSTTPGCCLFPWEDLTEAFGHCLSSSCASVIHTHLQGYGGAWSHYLSCESDVYSLLNKESKHAEIVHQNFCAAFEVRAVSQGSARIFRVNQTAKEIWPPELFGHLFSGQCYIVVYNYRDDGSPRTLLYLWQVSPNGDFLANMCCGTWTSVFPRCWEPPCMKHVMFHRVTLHGVERGQRK